MLTHRPNPETPFIFSFFSRTSNTPVFDVVSLGRLSLQPSTPGINATHPVTPATVYSQSVFTVTGAFKLTCLKCFVFAFLVMTLVLRLLLYRCHRMTAREGHACHVSHITQACLLLGSAMLRSAGCSRCRVISPPTLQL